jgi:hypothetical protein
VRRTTATIIGVIAIAAGGMMLQGCNIFGWLASPGPFEEKVDPEYDLKSQKESKIYVFVEAAPGSGANVGDADKLGAVVVARILQKTGIDKKYILNNSSKSSLQNPFTRPEQIAEEAGAGLVLYVHLEQFEILNLQGDKVYSGRVRCRSLLIDVQNGKTVWPSEEAGSESDVEVGLSDKGREEVVARLSTATAHCIVRHFYTCAKTDYRVNEERDALNEMLQQDVY